MNAGMMDQCIAVAKPCGYESHFITTIAAPLLPSWCLEIGVRYALLMRANKPETAVQSSALFLLAPRALFIMYTLGTHAQRGTVLCLCVGGGVCLSVCLRLFLHYRQRGNLV